MPHNSTNIIYSSLTKLTGILYFSLLSISCGNSPSDTEQGTQIPPVETNNLYEVDLDNGFTYKGEGNAIVRDSDGFSIQNPLFASSSNNRNYLIYSAVEETLSPEIFLQSLDGSHAQITNNDFIEPVAVVNNNGVYAYILSDHINNINSVYLHDSVVRVSDSSQNITNLAINRSHLAIGMGDRNSDQSHIETLDLDTSETVAITVPGLLEKLLFVSESKLAIQIFDTTARTLIIYIYDMITEKAIPLEGVAQGDQHMRLDENSGDLLIDVISGDPDSKMLFTALHTWESGYISNAFAYSNNFLGRMSWNSSYVTEGLIGLYRITGHPLFAAQVRDSVAAQLRIRNDVTLPGDSTVPSFLWATRKYSIDYNTPLTLFVDDAKVLYPMLVAANEGMLPSSLREEVVSVAEQFIDHLEQQYNSYERLYHIKYGVNFVLDGVWGPYNWQSAVGLVLVELFTATGTERYKDRANELAERFRSEWIQNPDGSILWSYWPSEFWAGWSESDGISTNMTSRPASTDRYYEDLSHAGINLKFALEHRVRFGPVPFTDSDMEGIRSTVRNFDFGTTFSRYMSGNIVVSPALYRNIPLYGWSQLESQDLSPYYASFVPGSHPSIVLSLAHNIQLANAGAELSVNSYRYSTDQTVILVRTTAYLQTELLDYFGLH